MDVKDADQGATPPKQEKKKGKSPKQPQQQQPKKLDEGQQKGTCGKFIVIIYYNFMSHKLTFYF